MFRRLGLSITLVLLSVAIGSTNVTPQSTHRITGVIKDPQGAVIAGARVTARPEAGEPRTATSDEQGRFTFENLPAGTYTLAVEASGFKKTEIRVNLTGARMQPVEIKLEVAAPTGEVTVRSKGAIAPNSEPAYRETRDEVQFITYAVENVTLKRDVGTLQFKSGTVSFLKPTLGRYVKAVFAGDGVFTLTPAIPIERDHMRMITDKDAVEEPFGKAVLAFTDDTFKEITSNSRLTQNEPRAADILRDFNERVRGGAFHARSFVGFLLASENLDAELLADIYNPKRPGFFNAYIVGKNFDDLRFLVRPRGALPSGAQAPEEVALVNLNAGTEKEGIWYLGHYESEYKEGTASSEEDKRTVDVQHYKIETAIESGGKLTATAEVTMTPIADGDRVVKFGLLPTLRVARVTFKDAETFFIQESRKEDGSFYAILPEPMVKGQSYKLNIEYRGDKVVEDAGGGNFAVGARTSWYPSVNSFTDRATFDLTFKVPKQYTIVGVGKMLKEWREGDFAASQWVSEIPLAVAGFNFGLFKKKSFTDETTKYDIDGYAALEMPAFARRPQTIGEDDPVGDVAGSITPARLLDKGMVEAQNSMRIFSKYFGEIPYGRVAITQQPQPNFGQSWPTLVYLPLVAFLDSTQRYMMLGRISGRLTEFIEEVTPHEVAHQWWGHAVGWASYHDQWLSEGFADFSAGLFLQLTEPKPDKYITYWQRHREMLLQKNQWGRRANDAGPVWMGLRLNTFKTPGAYGRVVYPKGGYILHMLRSIMWDNKTGDQKFIEMMRDFVKSNFNNNASTEGFKKVVERHMRPGMDLDANGRMDWFFSEWVYGTEVPSYKFQYSLTQAPDGKTLLKGTVSQNGVSPDFKMLVPIYVDFDGKIIRLGEANITGNSTTPEFSVKLPQKPKRAMINAYHDVLAVEEISEEIKQK